MMLLRLLLATAAAVEATELHHEHPYTILTSDDVLFQPYSALPIMSAAGVNDRKISPKASSTWSPEIRFAEDGEVDYSAWDEATHAACQSHLQRVTRSASPSGHSICYNLPMLDAKAGTFAADLRLYRVSELRGGFERVAPEEIHVEAAYRGANASVIKEHSNGTVIVTKRAEDVAGAPLLLQSYKLRGKIDKTKLQNLSMAKLQALVLPNLTLTALTPSGEHISSRVSANEASFLVGAFSKTTILSDWAAAQAAVDDQLAALRNGSIPFVVPGRHIMIFPIGLIITCVWLVIGVAVVGFGTYERIRYRRMYQRAVARAAALPPPPSPPPVPSRSLSLDLGKF